MAASLTSCGVCSPSPRLPSLMTQSCEGMRSVDGHPCSATSALKAGGVMTACAAVHATACGLRMRQCDHWNQCEGHAGHNAAAAVAAGVQVGSLKRKALYKASR
jgi:hypothetical protein